MKAKVMGFKWELKDNSRDWINELYDSIDSSFKYSISELQKIIEHQTDVEETSFEKIMGVKKHDNFWNGFLIGIKDKSSILKIVNEKDSLKLGSQNLNKNEKLVDVNFFVFDEEKLRGMYVYYHQSNWIDKFNKFVENIYDTIIGKKIDEYERSLGVELTSLQKANLRSNYQRLTTEIFTTKDNFETIVSNMKEINKISLTWTYDAIVKKDYEPLASISKSENTHFTISKHVGVKAVLEKLKESIPFAKEVSVYGKSEDVGTISDVVAKLTKNYKYFAEKEFSSVYGNLNIDFLKLDATLQNHDGIFRWLETLANKNL